MVPFSRDATHIRHKNIFGPASGTFPILARFEQPGVGAFAMFRLFPRNYLLVDQSGCEWGRAWTNAATQSQRIFQAHVASLTPPTRPREERIASRKAAQAHPDSLISIPLAATRTGLPVDAFVAEALRRHDEIPVYVQPAPPGWRAVLHQADPRSRVPEFEETFPDDVYDVMLTDRILLTPDVLREVIATGCLHRVTIDGLTVGTEREEIGYTAWSIGAQGKVETDQESAVTRTYKECFVLCEAQRVPLESLLVDEAALDLLRSSSSADLAPDPDAVLQRLDALAKQIAAPPDDVLSEAQAVERLPWRKADARRWLRREGLSVEADGRRVVVWEDVVGRLRHREEESDPAPSVRRAPAAGRWTTAGGRGTA